MVYVDCIFFFNKRLKKELVHKNALAGKQAGRIARDSGLFRVDCKACNWRKMSFVWSFKQAGRIAQLHNVRKYDLGGV